MASHIVKSSVAASLAFLFSATAALPAFAQPGPDESPMVTKQDQQEVLATLSDAIAQSYVDEKKATLLAGRLDELRKRTRSNPGMSSESFAESVTAELQKISGDQHLRVEYSEEPLDIPVSDEVVSDFQSEPEKNLWRARNLGFEKVERLPFNIGYLQLSAFAPVGEAKSMLAASFEFVKNTDSLIIDLRGNFGGFEYTDQLLASYFLTEKTHLLDMHWRKGGRVEQRWSEPLVDGPKYGDERPVYILIDKHTFSAGESFAYMMKNLGRATIIGETTSGAANAGEDIQLSPHFRVFLPTRRSVSPVTKTNFEGIGVKPDVSVASARALVSAQIAYLDFLKSQEQSERRLQRIDARIAELGAE